MEELRSTQLPKQADFFSDDVYEKFGRLHTLQQQWEFKAQELGEQKKIREQEKRETMQEALAANKEKAAKKSPKKANQPKPAAPKPKQQGNPNSTKAKPNPNQSQAKPKPNQSQAKPNPNQSQAKPNPNPTQAKPNPNPNPTPFVPKPKLRYPRFSSMCKAEQKRYLEMCVKYASLQPEDHNEKVKFKELCTRVSIEQNQFQQYLHCVVAEQRLGDYNYIHEEAKRYMKEHIEFQQARVRKYPKHYTQHDSVPISMPKVPKDIPFRHMQKLLTMGDVPKVIIPSLDGPTPEKLPVDYNKVNVRFPVKSQPKMEEHILHRQVVSEDPNCETLARKYEAHIVISSSGLQCLVDNHGPGFGRQWEIPVYVKEYATKTGRFTTSHKVVYIDKPFVPKCVPQKEQNAWFHKFAFKTRLLHPKHGVGTARLGGRSQPGEQHDQMGSAENVMEEDDDLFGCGIDDLETFGTVKTKARMSVDSEGNSEDSSDEDSDQDISDSIDMKGQISNVKTTENSAAIDMAAEISTLQKPAEDICQNTGYISTDTDKELMIDSGSEMDALPQVDGMIDTNEMKKNYPVLDQDVRFWFHDVPQFDGIGDSGEEDSLVIDFEEPEEEQSEVKKRVTRSRTKTRTSKAATKRTRSQASLERKSTPQKDADSGPKKSEVTEDGGQSSRRRSLRSGRGGDVQLEDVQVVSVKPTRKRHSGAAAKDAIVDDADAIEIVETSVKKRGRRSKRGQEVKEEVVMDEEEVEVKSEEVVLVEPVAKKRRGRPSKKVKQETVTSDALPGTECAEKSNSSAQVCDPESMTQQEVKEEKDSAEVVEQRSAPEETEKQAEEERSELKEPQKEDIVDGMSEPEGEDMVDVGVVRRTRTRRRSLRKSGENQVKPDERNFKRPTRSRTRSFKTNKSSTKQNEPTLLDETSPKKKAQASNVDGDVVDKGSSSEDVVDKGPISEDVVEKGTISEDIVDKESISEDNVNKGSISEDIGEKGSSSGDIVAQGSVSEDVVDKGTISGDIVEAGTSSGDIVEKGESTGDIFEKGTISAEIMEKGTISEDIVEKKADGEDIVEKLSSSEDMEESMDVEAPTKNDVSEKTENITKTATEIERNKSALEERSPLAEDTLLIDQTPEEMNANRSDAPQQAEADGEKEAEKTEEEEEELLMSPRRKWTRLKTKNVIDDSDEDTDSVNTEPSIKDSALNPAEQFTIDSAPNPALESLKNDDGTGSNCNSAPNSRAESTTSEVDYLTPFTELERENDRTKQQQKMQKKVAIKSATTTSAVFTKRMSTIKKGIKKSNQLRTEGHAADARNVARNVASKKDSVETAKRALRERMEKMKSGGTAVESVEHQGAGTSGQVVGTSGQVVAASGQQFGTSRQGFGASGQGIGTSGQGNGAASRGKRKSHRQTSEDKAESLPSFSLDRLFQDQARMLQQPTPLHVQTPGPGSSGPLSPTPTSGDYFGSSVSGAFKKVGSTDLACPASPNTPQVMPNLEPKMIPLSPPSKTETLTKGQSTLPNFAGLKPLPVDGKSKMAGNTFPKGQGQMPGQMMSGQPIRGQMPGQMMSDQQIRGQMPGQMMSGQPVRGQMPGQVMSGQPIRGQMPGQVMSGQPIRGQMPGQMISGQPIRGQMSGQVMSGQPIRGQMPGQVMSGQPIRGKMPGQVMSGQPIRGQMPGEHHMYQQHLHHHPHQQQQQQQSMMAQAVANPMGGDFNTDFFLQDRDKKRQMKHIVAETVVDPVESMKVQEDPKEFLKPVDKNVSYDLWEMGELRVLIRCGTHGTLRDVKNNVDRSVHLQGKVEHQPMYGVELITPSEASQAWISSLIRHDCKLIRGRIGYNDSVLMLTEELTKEQAAPPMSGFNPGASVQILHELLDCMSRQSAGHYLLSHSPGNQHAHIKKQTESKVGVYDLHRVYMTMTDTGAEMVKSASDVWVPLDVSMQLPWQKKLNRIPATFEPRDGSIHGIAMKGKGKHKGNKRNQHFQPQQQQHRQQHQKQHGKKGHKPQQQQQQQQPQQSQNFVRSLRVKKK